MKIKKRNLYLGERVYWRTTVTCSTDTSEELWDLKSVYTELCDYCYRNDNRSTGHNDKHSLHSRVRAMCEGMSEVSHVQHLCKHRTPFTFHLFFDRFQWTFFFVFCMKIPTKIIETQKLPQHRLFTRFSTVFIRTAKNAQKLRQFRNTVRQKCFGIGSKRR